MNSLLLVGLTGAITLVIGAGLLLFNEWSNQEFKSTEQKLEESRGSL